MLTKSTLFFKKVFILTVKIDLSFQMSAGSVWLVVQLVVGGQWCSQCLVQLVFGGVVGGWWSGQWCGWCLVVVFSAVGGWWLVGRSWCHDLQHGHAAAKEHCPSCDAQPHQRSC
jgi:hypothetical protein